MVVVRMVVVRVDIVFAYVNSVHRVLVLVSNFRAIVDVCGCRSRAAVWWADQQELIELCVNLLELSRQILKSAILEGPGCRSHHASRLRNQDVK